MGRSNNPCKHGYRRVQGFMLLGLCFFAPMAWAKGVALVIGNAQYTKEKPLANTLNDADDVAAVLRELDFDVTPAKNLKRRDLIRELGLFVERAKNRDGVAVLYYSGHGMQDREKRTYLLPVDAEIHGETDLKADGYELGSVLEELRRRSERSVSLVVVDACRNNPYRTEIKGSSRGLGRVTPPRGTLVLYAAEPDQTADDNPRERNGLFTKHLLHMLRTPGVEISQGVKQVAVAVNEASGGKQTPWPEGVVLGDFYLRPPQRGGSSGGAVDYDLEAWRSAERCGKAACYRAYLEQYPQGRFAGLARAQLGEPGAGGAETSAGGGEGSGSGSSFGYLSQLFPSSQVGSEAEAVQAAKPVVEPRRAMSRSWC